MVSVDSSSLILLAKISIFDKVISNSKEKLAIAERVYEESASKDSFDAKIIKKRAEDKALDIRKIKNRSQYQKIKDDFNLDKGEAEALVLSLENKTGLITDDKKAINACKALKIEFTTAVNLVASTYKKRLITKTEADIYLMKLEKSGRYSNDILQEIRRDIKDEKDE